MTPLQIAVIVALACAVVYWLYRICMHSAEKVLDGLSESPSLDSDGPCHQARCSTEPEPSTVEVLFCAVMIAGVILLFVWMWFGFGDEFARWAAMQVARAYPH